MARSHTVYAVDLPGHGYTRLKDEDFVFDLPGMADSIGTFMNAVGLKRAALVGHSWGGGWALRYAQLHPERVSRLVLISPTGLDLESIWQFEILEYPVIGEAMVNLMRRNDARRLMTQSFYDKDCVTAELVDEYWAPGSRPIARRALLDLQRNLDWSSTEAALSETAVPILLLWGENDAIRDVAEADSFVVAMPNAERRILENCGHSAHEDCPERANPAIIDFLTDPAP